MSRIEMENGPISRGSQSGMSVVRGLWWKGFIRKVSFEFRVGSKGVTDGWGKWSIL